MLVSYTLNMPVVRSWNGRWSGEGRSYVIVKSYRGKNVEFQAKQILNKGSFIYQFSDGWVARIDVRQVTAAEARKLRAKSEGFDGYDWMITSIEKYMQIQTPKM